MKLIRLFLQTCSPTGTESSSFLFPHRAGLTWWTIIVFIPLGWAETRDCSPGLSPWIWVSGVTCEDHLSSRDCVETLPPMDTWLFRVSKFCVCAATLYPQIWELVNTPSDGDQTVGLHGFLGRWKCTRVLRLGCQIELKLNKLNLEQIINILMKVSLFYNCTAMTWEFMKCKIWLIETAHVQKYILFERLVLKW